MNYFPNTMTKEDRRKNFKNSSYLDNEKTKKPSTSSDWMTELKNPKSSPQE